jgi:hypothetical protein
MAPQAPATPQPRMDTANGKFELMKDIGSGNFGVAKLMRDRQTGEMLAVKCAACQGCLQLPPVISMARAAKHTPQSVRQLRLDWSMACRAVCVGVSC